MDETDFSDTKPCFPDGLCRILPFMSVLNKMRPWTAEWRII